MQDTRGYVNHAREYFSQLLDEMAKYAAFRPALERVEDIRSAERKKLDVGLAH